MGSESPDIHIYSTQTGSIITSLTGHTNRFVQLNMYIYNSTCTLLLYFRVKSMAFVPGVNILFSASSNGSVRVWELKEDLVCLMLSLFLSLLFRFSYYNLSIQAVC